jgi:NAD(P)-dependent dehydrogenase (short-subunit alcohol dehydrogenase family)
MSNLIENNTYVVTGASKGFGLAIVKALLAQGAKVGMTARNKATLDAVISELNTDQVIGISADVANFEQMQSAFAKIKAHFGSFNGLINNAGMSRPGVVESLDETDLMLQINTNFVGTVLCCKAAIPLLRGQTNPRIINISSATAWHMDEIYHMSIYGATKAAVERFSRDLYIELHPDNIGVTCIRPGAAMTNFADEFDVEKATVAVNATVDALPYMRFGMEPEHVAQSVVQTLSYPAGVAVYLLEIRPNQRQRVGGADQATWSEE